MEVTGAGDIENILDFNVVMEEKAARMKGSSRQQHRVSQGIQSLINLIPIVFLLFVGSLNAALPPEKISFLRLLENQDVAVGDVQTIVQDQMGYIWIGGELGLLRYDGYQFQTMGEKDSAGQPVKNIFSMFVDSRGILWLCASSGLIRFYPENESFIRYRNDDRDPHNIPLADINNKRIAELPSGELLITSINGITVFDVVNNKTEIIRHDPNDENSLQGNNVWPIKIDKNNNVWVGGESGLDKIHWPTKKVTRFYPKKGKLGHITSGQVRSIEEDSQGNIWVGTKNGLNRIYGDKHYVQQIFKNHDDPYSIGSNVIWHIYEDSRGILWFGTDHGGLNYYNHDTSTFHHFKSVPGNADSITTNTVRQIFEDSNGDLWFAHFPTGVSYFDRSTAVSTVYTAVANNENSLTHNNIGSLAVNPVGNLWIGTDGGGLNYFDRKLRMFKHYKHDPNDPTSISGNAVLTILIDSEGELWAGTWGAGFNHFNHVHGNFTRYDQVEERKPGITRSDKLNSPNVRVLLEDSQGQMWVGTQDGALNKYDRKTGEFTHYMPDPNDDNAILHDIIYSILEDSKGRLWVGTQNSLELMDRKKETFTHFMRGDGSGLSNGTILCSFEDSKGRVWFGTYGGLNLLNDDGKTFQVFDKAHGLNDDVIKSILEDNQGTLWLGTGNGISSLNPDTGEIINYYKNFGWQKGSFNPGVSVKTALGELVFGGAEGFSILNLSELKKNDLVPPVVLTDFKLFTESIKIGDENDLISETLPYTDSITLGYTQSMFSFSFSALSYRNSGRNQYAYKLEGFDEDWRHVGTQRHATYTNIDSGKYIFRVKGSNNDEVWNDKGSEIHLIQLPPPWKTWWAYTIYSLMFLGAIYLMIDFQRRKRKRVEEQNRILEVKVAERTSELVQKNNDIQSMLQNMQQGLFTVLDGGEIHPEYSVFLETVFETKNIAGRDVIDLLFSQAKLSDDIIDQNKVIINLLIGSDVISFDFNLHLLIQEYEIETPTETKIISLDWNGIEDQDEIIKVMVTVRDVTLVKQLEKEASEQKRELDIVGQLLDISAKQFLDFRASSAKYIEENRSIIKKAEAADPDIVNFLFRNMHTLKGNARTYRFAQVCDLVHGVETLYDNLRMGQAEWDKELMLSDLESVESVLEEYINIYTKVLGRDADSNSDRVNGLWLDEKTLQGIKDCLSSQNYDNIGKMLEAAESNPIDEMLEGILASLPLMAEELGKDDPKVLLSCDDLSIKQQSRDVLVGVFTHMLRNSIDHGIEEPDERLSNGKASAGTISIRSDFSEDSLSLIIRDDGRGLNLDRLFKKGVDNGLWSESDKPSDQEIANLIFMPGVSTTETVTDISGRGVGMDAVKQNLEQLGGGISLVLQNEGRNSEGFIPFETKIKLSPTMYISH